MILLVYVCMCLTLDCLMYNECHNIWWPIVTKLYNWNRAYFLNQLIEIWPTFSTKQLKYNLSRPRNWNMTYFCSHAIKIWPISKPRNESIWHCLSHVMNVMSKHVMEIYLSNVISDSAMLWISIYIYLYRFPY